MNRLGFDGTRKGTREEGHWYVVHVDFRAQQIVSLDSLGHARDEAIRAVQLLIFELHTQRKQRAFSFLDWVGTSLRQSTPQQDTWFDCGVFALIAAWAVARRVPFDKAKEGLLRSNMGLLRRRLALWLLRGGVL